MTGELPENSSLRRAARLTSSEDAAQSLVRLTKMAREAADVACAYVGLIDGDQVVYLGADRDEPALAPRRGSIVELAIRKRDLVWVQDASREKRLAHDLFVEGDDQARFYAAAPIVLPPGRRAGALVLLDRRVRPYDGALAQQLKAMAREAAEAWTTPAAPERALAEPRQRIVNAADLSVPLKARVLLAEDHPTNRKVIELILQSAGVELTCVADGAEAVKAALGATYDLILMDMQMPVMDGLTATRQIREREQATGAPRVPILCLTANAMAEHIAASRAAGADSHLTKPISASALIGAVRRALQPPATSQRLARSA